MERLIDITNNLVLPVLDLLLKNKSTKKNIIWATDTYESLGNGFSDKEQMDKHLLLQHADIIRPRIRKSQEDQLSRTRKKAEVFTPAWVCNEMNNVCDEDWFDRKNVFNTPQDDHTWIVNESSIEFPKRKRWQRYVDSRRLEITCGEAPFLCSRYDTSTGEIILPLKKRIGIVDRKLRIVNENTQTYEEWVKWAIRAFDASYGYEYQGDNVLIARVNMLLTFIDYYYDRWDKFPPEKLIHLVANRIAWNIWQMDGLKDIVPTGKPYEEFHQITFEELGVFDWANIENDASIAREELIPGKIHNWRSKESILFRKVKEKIMGKKLFDYVIGNPPYNEDTEESTRKRPIYDKFMDESFKAARKIEVITPGRFLFNAGQTSKEWNKKILGDNHFKVLRYVDDGSVMFPNTDIKGGVAISYYDWDADYAPITVFTKYSELNSILKKVRENCNTYLQNLVSSRGCYRLSEKFFENFPDATSRMGKGTGNMIVSNIFEKIPEAFIDDSKGNEKLYIKIIGRENNERKVKYIKREYVISNEYIDTYNVLISEANNTGKFGETLVEPSISAPSEGATDTFLSIGFFPSKLEAENLIKYLKTKFCRALLGVKKATQHTPKSVWEFVPSFNFVSEPDIDWSQSIHEIDQQLYKKYRLDEKEINFIETHVKEMK